MFALSYSYKRTFLWHPYYIIEGEGTSPLPRRAFTLDKTLRVLNVIRKEEK